MDSILQFATGYTQNGFSVVPIRHGDKRPAIAWEQYQTKAANQEQVARWFGTGQYDALGIITGEVSHGLVILDFDGDGWEKARDEVLAEFHQLNETKHVKTGSGKLHIYLCADDLSNGRGEKVSRKVYKRADLGAGTAIELRGNAMQTLAPPSAHPSGGVYEFINDYDIARVPDLHSLINWLDAWQRNEKDAKRAMPTDDELAGRWIEADAMTAYGLNDWRIYLDGHWPIVPEEQTKAGILQICTAAKSERVRPTAARVSSVMELARLLTFVPTEKWDTRNDILVFENGTLDLKKFKLREHSPEDYATRAVPYSYDETATMPHFDYALYSTIPGAAEFLQEFAGYCLTIDTTLETAVWFYGPPGSGKSTLLHGITTMMGDMVGHLSLAQIERSQFSLADLPGKRLVMSTEQPSMYVRSTDILNTIISGEPVQIERKHKPAYTIIPQAKIIFAMNDLPRVNDASNGLFRRVKVLKFPALAPEARDEKLKRLISDEGAGIMNWALDGLRRLRKRGHFTIPECVTSATDDFKRENDKASLFVSECCETSPENRVQSQLLYNGFKEWCFENGLKPSSSTSMAREWERLGFEKKRINGKTWWQNVGLLVQV